MKRATCPLCRARALVEYGGVWHAHERPRIAPGGFDTLPVVMCYGPRPEAPAADAPREPDNTLNTESRK